ncbi:MAG: sigma factor [Sedimentisphaeraceae bacterium JB056]
MIEIDDYIRKIVSTKASLLLGRCGIGINDLEDIEQELYLELLKKAESYDPEKGKTSTFVQCILQKKISDILSRRKTEQKCRSFTETGRIFNDFIDKNDDCRSLQLQIDVQETVNSLTPELQEGCRLLARSERITHAAKKAGVKRSTFYYRVINPLRKAFKENGLEIYMENI